MKRETILDSLKEHAKITQALLYDEDYLFSTAKVAQTMAVCLDTGGKILFFGNGGSAADAQHLAAELNGRFLIERKALTAIALGCNTSVVTAIANDYSFDEVFSRQVEALGRKGDIAFGISTSGNSKNVLRALETARLMEMTTVGMTGASGNFYGVAHHVLRIPSSSTPRIQEAHILTGHILCQIIEQQLFGGEK